MDNNRPIGILDSGVGGLTVVKEILKQLPHEKLIYVGDTARCPYGPRPREEVKQFTFEIVDYLMTFNVKSIVIACNTATAYTLEDVKNKVDIPVIGVIYPGSIAATQNTITGKIGVIGTEGTISSGAYEKTLKMIRPDLEVIGLACPTLVPLVEENGKHTEENIVKVISEALAPLKGNTIDSLILGCTHYPIISEYIQQVVGENVLLISSAEETAKELTQILEDKNLLNNDLTKTDNLFFTTGEYLTFKEIGEKWLGTKIEVGHINI
ncbi:MAG: glutamate racemase [Vulcanibacillus sp.]